MRNAESQGWVVHHDACLYTPHSALRIPHSDGSVTDLPYRVEKPWGYELVWARTERYVGKILHIEPGQVLSLQYHNRKDETIHVLRGEIIFRVQVDGNLTERRMHEGESYHIVPPTVHQMEAVRAS